MSNNVWIILFAALIVVMNLLAFILMGVDKRRAKKGQWRIKEATLFLAAGLFGALGGTAGMYFFRHKTQHWYFKLGFPMLLALQIFAVGLVVGQLL